VNIMMTLAGQYDDLGFNCRHLVITKRRAFELLRCKLYILQNM